jgi:hypothetical protein
VYRFCIEPLIALIVFASLGMAAPSVVGIVTSSGSLTIDDAAVTGNATLFEGSRIETGTAPSQIQLNDGGRMLLGAESKGIVYRDRLVLERGSGRFENYTVEVSSVLIQAEGFDKFAEVAFRNSNIAGPGLVRVAAFKGPVRVSTTKGLVLVNLQAGRTFDFSPQDPETAAASIPPADRQAPGAPKGTGGAAAPPATASVGIAAKVAIIGVVGAGASAAAAVAVIKSNDQAAISPSSR